MVQANTAAGPTEWRVGAEIYRYEIEPGGVLATLHVGERRVATLPVVAWDGLIEALKGQRKSRTRIQAGLPPRAGARWTDAEIDDVATSFSTGVSPRELARRTQRTEAAVEHQLVKLGLLERRFGPQQMGAGNQLYIDTREPPLHEFNSTPTHDELRRG